MSVYVENTPPLAVTDSMVLQPEVSRILSKSPNLNLLCCLREFCASVVMVPLGFGHQGGKLTTEPRRTQKLHRDGK